MAKIAVGYARRSKESTERTVSLAEQDAAIREYARAQGFDLRWVLVDDGLSGRDRARYEPILRALKVHHASVLIVYHQDRLHRDVEEGLRIVRQLEGVGVELWVCGFGKVEVKTSGGYLQYAFGGVIAEYHAVLCSEKTTAGLRRKKLLGLKYSGIDPYGYHVVEGKLVPNKKEQEAIKEMVRLRRDGYSYRQIALGLEGFNIYARGGKRFSPSTVKKILDRGGTPCD